MRGFGNDYARCYCNKGPHCESDEGWEGPEGGERVAGGRRGRNDQDLILYLAF